MKRKTSRIIFLLVIPAVCLLSAGVYYMSSGRYVVTKNAYVKAKLINISSDIDGRVIDVRVSNNQQVKKGDLLFKIDPEPAEIELMAANAELKNVRQRIDSLKLQYKQALLEIDDARERNRFLASQLKRQQKLKQQGLGIDVEYDQAEHNLEMGRRASTAANQRSYVVLADLGGDPDLPAEEHSLYMTAQSKLNKARRELESTFITAPSDGVLSKVALEAGEYVGAGDLVFSIVQSEEVWVEANLKESQLTHLAIDQEAKIVIDAYPSLEFSARVTSVSPATGSVFAVLPPQNATGNWVKVVQRIPVRLDLELSEAHPPLRAGMTSTVTIDTRHQRELPEFMRSVFATGN